MPSSRGCRSSYDCIVKIKGVTTRPILFSQLMRSDGEGAMNPEELFADDRSPASEQERVHEDELHSLMRIILDWAISFLSEPSQGTIRAIYFEGKTVKQHSEEEYWREKVSMRSMRVDDSCPYCSGRKVLAGYNDLATTHPDIAAMRHPRMSKRLKPAGVRAASRKPAWWRGECGRVYQMAVRDRVGAKQGYCPYCSGRKRPERPIRLD